MSSYRPPISKTQSGVTLTVIWTYADAQRIGLEYQISGVAIPDGYQRFCPVREVIFSDEATKVSLGQNEIHCVADASGDFLVSQSFARTSAVQAGSVSISLDVAVGGIATIAQPVANAPARMPFEIADAGIFRFDLDIPVTSGLTFVTPQEVNQASVTATLKRAEINPSLTRAEICLKLPSNADWLPDALLTAGHHTVRGNWVLQNTADPATFTGSERCYLYSFPVSYELKGGASQFILSIGELRTSIPESLTASDIEEAQRTLEQMGTGVGFAVRQLEHGFTFDITQKPNSMTDDQAYQLIASALTESVKGPWSFALTVPWP